MLAAIFEEEQFAVRVLGEEEADGAVAADKIAQDAATGAHTVDLVNADVSAHIKLAPGFDENGAPRFIGEQRLEVGTGVFDIGDGGSGFDFVVIEAGRFQQAGRRQLLPDRSDDSDAQARIEAGGGVMS